MIQQSNPISTIVTGEDCVLNVYLKQGDNGQPFDLSSVSEIVAILPNADDTTFLECKLSTSSIILVSGPGGFFQVIITAAQSALLLTGPTIALDVRFTIAAKLTKVVIQNAVAIISPAYPTAP